MQLSFEGLPPIEKATTADIKKIMSKDSFGKFAILSYSEDSFMQLGNNWTTSDECANFLKANDSAPWILKYRDAVSGKIYQAEGDQTLAKATIAFVSYLNGTDEWRNTLSVGG